MIVATFTLDENVVVKSFEDIDGMIEYVGRLESIGKEVGRIEISHRIDMSDNRQVLYKRYEHMVKDVWTDLWNMDSYCRCVEFSDGVELDLSPVVGVLLNRKYLDDVPDVEDRYKFCLYYLGIHPQYDMDDELPF